MRGGTNTRGYTIVEVMIFLAVSGVMFVIAAGFVSGKQATTEFRQGMNSINSQVQQTINDVGNGFYPSNGGFLCQASGGGPLQFTGTASEQGSNQGCVFLGKIMQFSVDTGSGPDSTIYNVFSVAGRQNIGDTNTPAPSTFVQAQPALITSPVDLTEQKTLEWGVQVTGMYNGPVAAANSIGAVGFFGSFNQSSRGSSQTVTAVAVPHSQLGQTKPGMIGVMNTPTELSDFDTAVDANPNPNITICFKGGSGHFGSLTIGGTSGQRLATSIRIGPNAAGVGC